MTPRPLIHVGMPKCASTWLQRHYFVAAHGYAAAQSPFGAHLALAEPNSFRLADWSQAREMFNLNQADNVPVITQETLVGNPLTGGHDGEANLHRLRQCVPEGRVLMIIREQEAMLRSLYKTLVNFGSPLTIGEHLRNDLAGTAPVFNLDYLRYDRAIAAYQTVFGSDSVMVLPLELFESKPEEFLRRIDTFCDIADGAYPAAANVSRRENVNQPLLELEWKRFFNRFIARTRMSPRGWYTPGAIGGSGNLRLPALVGVNRWLERRFAAQVKALAGNAFDNSNANTQALTGLDLAGFGYQLPA